MDGKILNPGDHLSSIDGLRGLLALWVFFGHLAGTVGFSLPLLSRPGLAVDFFMFLSGFLMAWHWVARETIWHSKTKQTIDFYIRRFFRIAPVYYVCLSLIIVFFDTLLMANTSISRALLKNYSSNPIESVATFENIFLHVTFLFGLFPSFAQNNPLPDWSISLEMQFYFVFPVMLAIIRRLNIFIITVFLFPFAILSTKFFGTTQFPGLFLTYPQPSFLVMKLPIFLAGMIFSEILRTYRKDSQINPQLFCAFVASLATCDKYIIIGTITIAYILMYSDDPLNRYFSSKPMRWLGRISYGVYLTHIPIMLLALWALTQAPAFLALSPPMLFIVSLICVTPFIVIFSVILNRMVEEPGITFGRILCKRLQ